MRLKYTRRERERESFKPDLSLSIEDFVVGTGTRGEKKKKRKGFLENLEADTLSVPPPRTNRTWIETRMARVSRGLCLSLKLEKRENLYACAGCSCVAR